MSGVNKVILIGRLGRDPEARTIPNGGGELVTLSLATSETWKDRTSGERKEKTEWHTVVLFQEAAVKAAKQYLRKGGQVYIEGKLQTRKRQDQHGNDRYSTEVVVQPFGDRLVLLDRKPDDPGRHDYGSHQGDRWQSGAPGGTDTTGGTKRGFGDLDDDVPF